MKKGMKRFLIVLVLAVLEVTGITFLMRNNESFAAPVNGVYVLTYPDGSTLSVENEAQVQELQQESKWKLLGTYTTDTNGKITLPTEWETGEIKIEAIEVPEGYTKPSSEIVNLSAEGRTQTSTKSGSSSSGGNSGTGNNGEGSISPNTPGTPGACVNCDDNGDGVCDRNCNPDANGIPTINIDINGDGKCDINCDTNNDKKCDYNCDTNGDYKPDINIDTNGDGKPDINIDTDGNGKPDLNIDINGDNKADINVDTDGDGTADKNLINQDKDNDGICDLNCDTNNDGYPDTNLDIDGDGNADLNIDKDNDGKCDLNCDSNGIGRCTLNCDTNGDGVADTNIDKDGNGKPDLNIDINGDGTCDVNCDTTGDGKADSKLINQDTNNDGKCDLNCDINNDGYPDINLDLNGDGKPDLNIDINGDGKADINIDTNGDGKPDLNIDTNGDNKCDLNCDTNGDGKPDTNIDLDLNGICDFKCSSYVDQRGTNLQTGAKNVLIFILIQLIGVLAYRVIKKRDKYVKLSIFLFLLIVVPVYARTIGFTITLKDQNGKPVVGAKYNIYGKPTNTEFEEGSYSIHYELDGGTCSNCKSTYKETDNDYTLPTPTKNTYVFKGWYTESSFTNKITNIPSGSTGNKTYYAKWSKYRIISGDLDTVGSIVKIADEEFYVIGKEGSNTKLLAKWNLKVGGVYISSTLQSTYTSSDPGYGLQDENMKGYVSGKIEKYGTLAFSSTNYWTYTSGAPYIYNNQSNLYQYVEDYVSYLNQQGVSVSGRLIQQEELVALGCNATVYYCNTESGGTAPSWVYQTAYWSGSASNTSRVWYVGTRSWFTFDTYSVASSYGVRPVIILEP